MSESPASALFEEGLAHHQGGRATEAEAVYRQVLEIDPSHKQAWSNLGSLFSRSGRLEEAVEAYRRALAIDPGFSECWFNLGNAYRRGGQPALAEGAFVQALQIQPGFEAAAVGLSQSLLEQGKWPAAINLLRTILNYNPEMVEAWFLLGNALRQNGQPKEALECHREYARLKPQDPKARHQFGLGLMDLGLMDDALSELHQALALDLASPTIHNTLGILHHGLGREDMALRHSLEAVRLKSDFTEAWNNLGNLLSLMGQPEGALSAFRKTLELRPDAAPFHSNLLLNLHYHPEMTQEAIHLEHIEWSKRHIGLASAVAENHGLVVDPERKLKVGFVSADFREHTVAAMLESLLIHLDRSQVEVTAYASVNRPDARTEKFRRLADRFRDIIRADDGRAAEAIREDEIDILVDFSGHTSGNRLGIFAYKPAPIQLTQFGYPNTTGVPGIDYRLTDRWADPVGKTDQFHTETLLRMDRLCWVYTPPEATAGAESLQPRVSGGPVVFGCFNNLAKVNDRVLAVWARILAKVPGSQLRLLADLGDTTKARIEGVLKTVEVDPGRVVRMGRTTREGYLRAQAELDIALDPFPYNGAVTTCDALWMGTPVLTLAGSTYASRQGVAILSQLGLEEWIASNEREYIEKAVKYALDSQSLNRLRGELRQRMATSPVCDAAGYARAWEGMVRRLWRTWCEQKNG